MPVQDTTNPVIPSTGSVCLLINIDVFEKKLQLFKLFAYEYIYILLKCNKQMVIFRIFCAAKIVRPSIIRLHSGNVYLLISDHLCASYVTSAYEKRVYSPFFAKVQWHTPVEFKQVRLKWIQ